jgi:Mg2+-importing ATPase
MMGWWQRRSLRARMAAWFAVAGVGVWGLCLMAALVFEVWRPADHAEVIAVLALGLPGAAVLFALAGYFVAGRLLTPVQQMVERAQRLSAESLSERLPVANPHDELGRLATVFNETLQRLENSFAELRRFSADASHELRTPLAAMRTVGEVGLREGNPVILYDVVGSMLEEVARMNQLLDRLLLLARTEGGAAPVNLETIRARDALAEVADALALVAEEKGQSLDVSCHPDLRVVADPAWLRLALMNLAQNALRHGPEHKPVRLRAVVREDRVRIEVADEGPGIAPEHHAKIFERFYRVDKARTRADGGAGLGLAIVKGAVERMGGTVGVESEPGRGSVFWLRLPWAGGGEDSEEIFSRSSVTPAPASGEHGDMKKSPATAPTLPAITPAEAATAPAAEVLTRLQTSPAGLSWDEARRRLEEFGPNEIAAHRPPSWPVVLWQAAKNPFNGVLLALGIVSLVTDDLKAVIVMATMITVATGLRFWQERKSQVQAESLRKMVRNKVTVLRANNAARPDREPNALDRLASDILMEELVPGDIVKLSAGDMVPGDLRLLESRDLFVTQSALTGEAMPVEKIEGNRRPGDPPPARSTVSESANPTAAVKPAAELLDQPNLLFMGSSIVSGTARAVVLATGSRTFFGAMAAKIVGRRPQTAFDLGVNRVSWLLIRFMLVMVPIVFFLNGLVKGEWMESFLFAIAVAVGLTPEMLPMIVNANLARGAVAMAREKVIVKQLNAIQNFGAMDVLCTDKTGTLTRDKVVLIKHLDGHGHDSKRVLELAYLNSLFQTGLKNLLDRAVIDRAHEVGGLREIAKSFWKIDEIPFDFTRRRMSVVLEQSSKVKILVCKGAVEEMLDICTKMEDGSRVVPLTPELTGQLKQLRDRLNEDGLRVVAVAYKAIRPGDEPFTVADESDLIFSGFIAFLDPPKETTAEALRLLREHGVAVKILTGDNAVVARKICRDVGLDVAHVITGAELQHVPDDALGELAERTTVFAKLSPDQKARVVQALKARGHTVGFMGDGINDAAALRRADVGISVDTAVDVAKEAADLILLEKSLLVLERGVLEGRRTFGNIIKYIKMTASSNFGNVFSVLVASAFLPFLPMLAIQLLVQNLLYDLSQISIPWDRMDREFLKRPRQWEAKSIATFMVCIGPISSIFDITTFFVMWHVFGANSIEHQSLFQSGWFVVGLLTQTLIVHMIRTEKIPFVQSTAAPVVLLCTGVIMAVGIWIPFSPLAPALKLQPLPPGYFIFLPTLLLCYCLLTQFLKQFYIRKFKSWL